jgi:hypothetical protein
MEVGSVVFNVVTCLTITILAVLLWRDRLNLFGKLAITIWLIHSALVAIGKS